MLPKKIKKAFANDLKSIYHAPNEESGYERMQTVTEKMAGQIAKCYEAVGRKPGCNITNVQIFSRCEKGYVHHQCIESLNSALRRLNSQRSAFHSDTALLKALYLATFEAMKKWTMPLRNWSKVYGELSNIYDSRLR